MNCNQLNHLKAQEIIALISKLENTPGGFRHKEVAVQLSNICLKNPGTAAALVFDENSLNEIRRERLLFRYSTDHWGSLWIRDNPQWAAMMREIIIPLMEYLPEQFQEQIKWHQEMHGL